MMTTTAVRPAISAMVRAGGNTGGSRFPECGQQQQRGEEFNGRHGHNLARVAPNRYVPTLGLSVGSNRWKSVRRRTAIINGSSKGLGLAMAKEFLPPAANVAILARSPDALAEAQATDGRGLRQSGNVSMRRLESRRYQQDVRAVIRRSPGGYPDQQRRMSRAMPSDQITDDTGRRSGSELFGRSAWRVCAGRV